MITQISALAPVMWPWEACILKLLEKKRPSSVSFICQSDQHCPDNNVYKTLDIPSQTIFKLQVKDWPFLNRHDIVFLLDDSLISWNEEAVMRYRHGGRNNFKLVIVAKMSESFKDDLGQLFAAIWRSGIVRCAVILVNSTSAQLYTYLPFKNSSICEDTSPVLLGDCLERADANEVFDLTYKVIRLHKR